jgi:NAD(P)-dependent dehydrogenase (short-subunit alcohol dehydrogenase family)
MCVPRIVNLPASKAALDGMIRAAQEIAFRRRHTYQQRVNPGIIDTNTPSFADDVAARPFIEHTPLRQSGYAQRHSRRSCVFARDARFVTGQTSWFIWDRPRAWVAGTVSASVGSHDAYNCTTFF